ncbi:MAG TPA: DUF1302 family protein [Candidatus Binataceae bacterium]|jgi:hypothetical protein|nr:DUF1302 family protein [Candidatus Binataceae bacterium]
MKPQGERCGLASAVVAIAVLAWLGFGVRPAQAQAGGSVSLSADNSSAAQTEGDVLAQTGSGSLLAQAAGAQQAGTPWYKSPFVGSNAPFVDVSETPGPLQGLSVSGFVSNTTGMWVNSSAIRYQKSKNSLATERNWLQLDINYVLNGNNRFFIRWWGVYEPSYPFEKDAGMVDMEDFYNQYTVRDAYWKSTMGPLTLFLGRQIVTWGESLAFRVGDVINPQDFTWNFGFANLEQSRLPLYMVHPILSLPRLGPLTSNFVEGVWAPAWQPMYTQMDYPNMCNPTLCPGYAPFAHSNFYDGQHDVGGSVSLLPPFTLVSEARFQTQPYPLVAPGFLGIPSLTQNQARMFAFPQLFNPAPPFFGYHLPGDTLGNSVEGFRLHTLLWNSEITAIYWHGHQFNEAGTPGAPFYVDGSQATGQVLRVFFPQFNDVGITMNRPLYLPGELLSSVPLVLRTEAIWQDRTPLNTTDLGVPNGVVDKNTINTLVALDLDGLYVPWLTKTGTLSANLEWNNFSILGYGRNLVYTFYAERWRHNEEQILFSVNTNWWWGAILPTYTMIWNPSGNTTLLFPTLTLTPPWTNKYFTTLEYIGILGNDRFNSFAGGIFKGKSILLMQFQYNFSLVKGRT